MQQPRNISAITKGCTLQTGAVLIAGLFPVACSNRAGMVGGKATATYPSAPDTPATVKRNGFTPPQIPAMLTSAQERTDYLTQHWWEGYHFADSAFVASDSTEQVFADFCYHAAGASPRAVQKGIEAALTASLANQTTHYRFRELFEKYLHDPNSPIRNEAMYEVVADYLIASDIVPEIEKSAPRLHKKQINMNRPGTVAADFMFVSAYGGRRAMHSIAARYTLLLFYDTDCPVCKSAKQAIQSSSVSCHEKLINFVGKSAARVGFSRFILPVAIR